MLLPIRIETEIEKLPVFTYLIVAANAAVFLSIHFLPATALEVAYYDYGLIPERVDAFSTFASMFIHVGWLHIVGNMYFLFLFGRAVEQRVNRPMFALLYFSGGGAGGWSAG